MNQSILSNHNLVILPGCFASEAVSSEMEALRDAVERGEEMKIRDDGTIVTGNEASSLGQGENLVSVKKGEFASDAVANEMEALKNAIERGEEMKIRDDGTIVTGNEASSLGQGENLVSVKKGEFA